HLALAGRQLLAALVLGATLGLGLETSALRPAGDRVLHQLGRQRDRRGPDDGLEQPVLRAALPLPLAPAQDAPPHVAPELLHVVEVVALQERLVERRGDEPLRVAHGELDVELLAGERGPWVVGRRTAGRLGRGAGLAAGER